MNEKGFIVIDRKIKNWQWWYNPTARSLWLYLLIEANWKSGYNKDGLEIKRGQLCRSLRKIAEENKGTVKTIRYWLKIFENSGEIVINRAHYYQVINIVNYDKYQDNKNGKGTSGITSGITSSITSSITSKGTDITIYNNNNNINKETNIYSVLEKLKNEDVRKEMMRFIESLKKNGKQITSSIVEKLIKNLEKLSRDEDEQKEIIKQSEERGWVWFYALKKSNYKSNYKTRVIPQAEYMKSDCEEEQEDEEDEEERNRLIGELKARLQRGEY